MRNKNGSTRGFRPRGKTERWIEHLEQLNVNISDFVNKILDEHIEGYASAEANRKRAELQKVLSTPSP